MSTATPSIKEQCLAKAWELVKTGAPAIDRMGLPSRTWADLPLRTRAVLVMLGATSMEDPRKVAQLPWGSLSDADRVGISAVAKDMQHDLRNAACLF
jgi:hypothetical protein